MAISWDRAFVDYTCEKLQQSTERVCNCLDKLEPHQIWVRGSTNENAVGNLVLHLCGNVRQWIVFGVGGKPDVRERDLEFTARGGVGPEELKNGLRAAVAEAVSIVRGLTPGQFEESTTVQGYRVSVLQAVYHVVEHFSGHTGQIIFATKALTGQDLGFYRHLQPPGPHREKAP